MKTTKDIISDTLRSRIQVGPQGDFGVSEAWLNDLAQEIAESIEASVTVVRDAASDAAYHDRLIRSSWHNASAMRITWEWAEAAVAQMPEYLGGERNVLKAVRAEHAKELLTLLDREGYAEPLIPITDEMVADAVDAWHETVDGTLLDDQMRQVLDRALNGRKD